MKNHFKNNIPLTYTIIFVKSDITLQIIKYITNQIADVGCNDKEVQDAPQKWTIFGSLIFNSFFYVLCENSSS